MTASPTMIDLSGLPGPVAESIRQLVESLRSSQIGTSEGQPPQRSIIGLFADEGVTTPSLEEFQNARREMSANFPRDFPDAGR